MPQASSSTGDPDADAVIEAASTPAGSTSSNGITGDPDADAVISAQAQLEQPDNFGRQLGLVGRAVATGAAALPLMAADAGVGAGNLIRRGIGLPGNDLEMPSKYFQDALTQAGFPTPKSWQEKIAGGVESTLSGAAMPMPAPQSGVPANFQTPEENIAAERLRSVKTGMDQGYRVPPATTNPTLANQGLETVAGKLVTQQAASTANQQVTNRLAAEALGLDPSVPITENAIVAVRSEAAKNYQAIAKAGPITLDAPFKEQIAGIVGRFNQTAEELPSLANKDLEPVATELSGKNALSGQAVLGAIRRLRDLGDAAFRNGEGGTGSAYRQMASALEGAVDRDLSNRGPEFQGIVGAFRTARQQIAISHSVEDAMNPGTGNIVAGKLAAALRRGEPLSGPLRTIAEFANSVPKAVQEPTSSPVSHLNIVGEALGGMVGAHVHGAPGAAVGAVAYPAARMGAKWWLMGPGQSSAIPAEKAAGGVPWWLKAAPAATDAAQE